MNERAPILVGAAQLIERDVELDSALEPLGMLNRVARDAADDAEVTARVFAELDTLGIVDVMAWRPTNGPRLLAECLGAKPQRELVTATGGEMALALLDHVAHEIEGGRARIALAVGCNDLDTLARARKAKRRLPRNVGGAGRPTRFGKERAGSSKSELEVGLAMPADVYPIFENALRAARGLGLEAHRLRMGALFSRFSEAAAANPYAWFPIARSAEELVTASPDNRMVAYPYTKYLDAIMRTNQAAGVLMMSVEAARSYGVPEERRVHWWGGGRSEEEAWYPTERPSFAACPALRRAVDHALGEADTHLDEIDHLDLYSCFPVAVEMACEMLGIAEDDHRGLTVTGGLPYAGGPGNNYTLHAVAAAMERLRGRPGRRALVTGNGWYLTKHSACVIASEPRRRERAAPPVSPAPDPTESVVLVEKAEGPSVIETYTVLYDREGAPTRGIVVGRLPDGRRFLANTPKDRGLLESLAAVEGVGRSGRVAPSDGINCFSPS